ncbi:MAG: ABC transporter permease [Gemmatimonadales bacterium]
MSGVALRLIGIQVRDVVRSRWILVYTSFFLLLTEGLLRFSASDEHALLSLATASLMVVPLAMLVLATIHVYNAREFTELLLAQPIARASLFAGLYGGFAIPAAGGYLIGVGLPFLVRGVDPAARGALLTLLLVGGALTFAFAAIACAVALRTEDRLRGVGIALGVWLFTAVLYDGLVLIGVALLSDYPIERPLLGLMFANPVDLARVLLLMHLDAAALLGYTGAVFERFFSGARGTWLAAGALAFWIALPSAFGARCFRRKAF